LLLQEFVVNKRINLAGLLAVIVLAAGCRSSGGVADGGSDDPFAVSGGGGSDATTTGLGGSGNIALTEEEFRRQQEMEDLMQNVVVYFDFDQSDIRPEFNDMLEAHADYLSRNPTAHVRLEGHADETGSREYTIGLGERRAQAVRRILMLQRASANQLSTVSYGEERPAALGSDEESYSLNRRVELVYE
jgi:peptidoglycan-associated lipoprotein